jgi:centrin-1
MSLDDDGSGSIGIQELEEPLIGLGIAKSLDEVQDMVNAVDDDGSGMIEFEEFLGIISGKLDGADNPIITQFFKDLSNQKIGNPDLSFQMKVQELRRNTLMELFKKKKKEFDEDSEP